MEEVHRIEHNTPPYGQPSLINQDSLKLTPTLILSYERYKDKCMLIREMRTQPVLMKKRKRRLVRNLKA